jgi:biofilm PGA synthesis protein PgaA
LFEYDQAFIRAGSKPEVAREYVVALQKARLPEPALRLANQRPGLIDPVTLRRLEGDLAAERVRLAELATRSEKERYVIADRALADYDKLLATWTPDASAHDDVIRWRIDRMGALKARARTADVINEYQKLQSEGVKIDLRLALGRRVVSGSAPARSLYRPVSPGAVGPDADVGDRLEDTTALFYSLLESDRADEARKVAEDWPRPRNRASNSRACRSATPTMSGWTPSNSRRRPAPTARPAARRRAPADTGRSGPGNIGLRLAQADLYLARQWPRRAENQPQGNREHGPARHGPGSGSGAHRDGPCRNGGKWMR